MDANLIVHYGKAGYMSAKSEIHAALTRSGDQKETQDLLMPGFIGVKTALSARDVIEELHESYLGNPELFHATLLWTPADHWCKPTVDDIKKTIKEEIKDNFFPTDRYLIQVVKHKGTVNEEELVNAIKPLLKGTPETEHPSKIIRIELFDQACVSLIAQKDIFIVAREQAL